MPVEATAGDMVDTAGKLSEDKPRATMSGVDILVSVLAVEVATNLRGQRADRGATKPARRIGMAVVAGEAVTGEEAITGIRPLDIRWAIRLGYGYPSYGIGYYGYPYGGYYGPYHGYYPYRYGYWPSVTFSFGYLD